MRGTTYGNPGNTGLVVNGPSRRLTPLKPSGNGERTPVTVSGTTGHNGTKGTMGREAHRAREGGNL